MSPGLSAFPERPLVCRGKRKDESHSLAPQLTLPPLDLESWILVVPFVSHVSECSTIRTAFALPRRDDNGAETSTRLAKEGKTRSRRNLGIVFPHYSKI